MPLSFPSSPTLNQQSVQNGRTFVWTGYAWELLAASSEDALLRSLFVPPAPTGLTATAGNAQAALSWTAPSGVIAQAPITDYREQYSTDNGSTWTTFTGAAASTATSATVTGLVNEQAVRFRVAAVNAIGVGAYSGESSAVTPTAGTPPNSPTGLTATAGNAQISLAWTAPSAPGTSAIADYTVEYTPSGGSAQTVSTGSSGTSYTLTGLTNGTAYTVRVAGVNAVGTGAYSGTATATPSAANPVTVSPATIQGRYGGAPYTWSGAGTSSNKLTTGGAVRSNNFAISVVRNVTFTCNSSGTLFFESNRIDDGEGGLYYQTFLSYRKNGGAESTAWATAQTNVGDVWRRGVSVTAGDTIILQNVGTNLDGVEAVFSVWIE